MSRTNLSLPAALFVVLGLGSMGVGCAEPSEDGFGGGGQGGSGAEGGSGQGNTTAFASTSSSTTATTAAVTSSTQASTNTVAAVTAVTSTGSGGCDPIECLANPDCLLLNQTGYCNGNTCECTDEPLTSVGSLIGSVGSFSIGSAFPYTDGYRGDEPAFPADPSIPMDGFEPADADPAL